MTAEPATVLTLIDGVRIVVPDSLDRIADGCEGRTQGSRVGIRACI
jgi:hypothetical protein